MSQADAYTVHIDGASRGNPGPAAYACVFHRDGVLVAEESSRLGQTTNNIAEYTALVRALEKAVALGAQDITIYSDSELMVKQMNGEYRVKNPDLRVLFDQAQDLRRKLASFTIKHVPRARNSHADRLCNEALDGQAQRAKPAAPARKSTPSGGVDPVDTIRVEAVACLRNVAAAWAQGNPSQPPPEQVWDQLWSIVEDSGLLRRPRSH